MGQGILQRHQASARAPGLGDDDLLAGGGAVHQPGKLGLGLVEAHRLADDALGGMGVNLGKLTNLVNRRTRLHEEVSALLARSARGSFTPSPR